MKPVMVVYSTTLPARGRCAPWNFGAVHLRRGLGAEGTSHVALVSAQPSTCPDLGSRVPGLPPAPEVVRGETEAATPPGRGGKGRSLL